MPQGLSAYRPTAYPARPEASTRATGHVPQRPQARAQENARTSAAFSASPVRRRPSPQQNPNNRWQQNQDRRAASATTNAPAASSRQFHDFPMGGHSARAEVPQTCPLRHAVVGNGDDWGLQRLGNLIALRDGHCAGFGPSIRRPPRLS